MTKIPKPKPIILISLVFLGGILIGFLTELLIPLFDITNLYKEWGFWGTIGRIGIIIFLFSIPISYFLWLVFSLFQISKPQKPLDSTRGDIQLSQDHQIARILLPVGDGPNAMLGLQLVSQLTNIKENGLITLLRILPPSMQKDVNQQKKVLENLVHESLLNYQKAFDIEVEIKVSDEVVRPIIELAQKGHYDLLVVGASERSIVGRFLFGSIPIQIAEQAPCPIVIIRRAINNNS